MLDAGTRALTKDHPVLRAGALDFLAHATRAQPCVGGVPACCTHMMLRPRPQTHLHLTALDGVAMCVAG